MDSAAVESVMPRHMVDGMRSDPTQPLRQGAAAKAGVTYVSADGGEIPNEGEHMVEMLTKEGHHCGMTWQVADIQKPLLAVTALASTGHEVRFRENDGEIVHKKSGKNIKFIKKGNLYVLTVWMKEAAGFRRQGF